MGSDSTLYPRDEFHAEYRKVKEVGGFGGDTGRLLTQIKYVLPGMKNVKGGMSYTLKSALVLQQAGIRNDLHAIWNQVTLKGIGSPESNQKPSTNPIGETTEFIFEQIGLGGAQGLLKAWLNRLRYHIDHSARQRIDLDTADGKYGQIDIDHALLHSTSHLPNNNFKSESFEIPKTTSGILLSTIRTKMSRSQVQAILEKSKKVNRRYDQTPRIIHRMHLPDSLFDNQGVAPRMKLFVLFHSSQDEYRSSQSLEIPIGPVIREINKSS